MSIEIAATVLAGLIFGVIVYVVNFKRVHGRLPKIRNPFV